jgi:hypothetical protein
LKVATVRFTEVEGLERLCPHSEFALRGSYQNKPVSLFPWKVTFAEPLR